MKTIILLLFLTLMLSCQKHNVEVGDYQDSTITIFGEITSQQKIQFIKAVKNSGINEYSDILVDNAQVTIFNSTNVYHHTYSNNGFYLSDSLYSLTPNNIYSFKLTANDSIYQSEFVMPTPIIITDIITNKIEDFNTNKLSINVNYTNSTFFITDIFKGKIDTVLQDTSWVLHTTTPKIYDCTASNLVVILSEDENLILEDYNLVKVVVKSLSYKTADYFKKLYDYRQNISTTNQYVNPPKNYFKNAYGCVYGTYISTFIKAL